MNEPDIPTFPLYHSALPCYFTQRHSLPEPLSPCGRSLIASIGTMTMCPFRAVGEHCISTEQERNLPDAHQIHTSLHGSLARSGNNKCALGRYLNRPLKARGAILSPRNPVQPRNIHRQIAKRNAVAVDGPGTKPSFNHNFKVRALQVQLAPFSRPWDLQQ
jgi:hypothetical protein